MRASIVLVFVIRMCEWAAAIPCDDTARVGLEASRKAVLSMKFGVV